ncbi:MAG: universal stress protein [Proteobacteria bacterium]|nr:universal stress protein [Pseudomonadota bacterium]
MKSNSKDKKKVLLVLATSGTPEPAIEYAVKEATEIGATLVALYPVDDELASEAFDNFTDIGFIGDKPSSELSESLMREYRQRGYEELGAVQVGAMEAGVEYEPIMEEGSFVPLVLDVIGRYEVTEAVLVSRHERSFLKYFSKDMAGEIKKRAGCTVVIFPEK